MKFKTDRRAYDEAKHIAKLGMLTVNIHTVADCHSILITAVRGRGRDKHSFTVFEIENLTGGIRDVRNIAIDVATRLHNGIPLDVSILPHHKYILNEDSCYVHVYRVHEMFKGIRIGTLYKYPANGRHYLAKSVLNRGFLLRNRHPQQVQLIDLITGESYSCGIDEFHSEGFKTFP